MATFDPYHKWLAIPLEEQPADYYQLLGLSRFEANAEVIETQADLRMSFIQQMTTGPHVALSQQILNELAEARICLLDPERKAAYDLELGTRLESVFDEPADSEPIAPAETQIISAVDTDTSVTDPSGDDDAAPSDRRLSDLWKHVWPPRLAFRRHEENDGPDAAPSNTTEPREEDDAPNTNGRPDAAERHHWNEEPRHSPGSPSRMTYGIAFCALATMLIAVIAFTWNREKAPPRGGGSVSHGDSTSTTTGPPPIDVTNNAPSCEPLGELMQHEDGVQHVAFSPDGERLATVSGHAARLWDARSGAPLGELMRHESWVRHVAFSPDGERLATASHDGTARLWDARTGAPLGEPMWHEDEVWHVAFSPDSERLATASYDRTARLCVVRC